MNKEDRLSARMFQPLPSKNGRIPYIIETEPEVISANFGKDYESKETAGKKSDDKIIDDLLAEANKKRAKYARYVAYYAVHSGRNRNGIVFTDEEIEKSYKTIIDTSVNWEHNAAINIGQNIYAKIQQHKGKKAILVLAKFDKYNNFDALDQMSERHSGGVLRFSMEAYIDLHECTKCGTEFSLPWDACECALDGADLIAKEIEFCGVGVVQNPADKNAESYAMASINNNKMEEEMEEKYAELEKKFEAYKEESASKEKELAEQIESLKKDVETLKAEKETASKEIEDLNQKLGDVTIEKVKAERLNAIQKTNLSTEDVKEIAGKDIHEISDETFNAILKTKEVANKSVKPSVEEDSEEVKTKEIASEDNQDDVVPDINELY